MPRIPVATGILASLRISLHKIQKTSAFHLIPGITKITDYVFMEEDLFLMQNIWGFSGTLETNQSGNSISLELTLTRGKQDLGSTWVSIVLFLQSGGGGLCPLASGDISDTDPSLQRTARSISVLLPARWSEAPLTSDSTLETGFSGRWFNEEQNSTNLQAIHCLLGWGGGGFLKPQSHPQLRTCLSTGKQSLIRKAGPWWDSQENSSLVLYRITAAWLYLFKESDPNSVILLDTSLLSSFHRLSPAYSYVSSLKPWEIRSVPTTASPPVHFYMQDF